MRLDRASSIYSTNLDIGTLNNTKSKCSIVKSALNMTYNFINKIKEDNNNNNIDIIIVTFDDNASIYSTIDIDFIPQSYKLVKSVKKQSFDEIKQTIQNLEPRGGTNFFAVKEANNLIDQNIKSFKSIKYIMSDGNHMMSLDNEFNRENLFKQNEKGQYTYSLGIGNENQYDKELLEYFSNEFIAGTDENDIHDSIVGDTFGCVSLLSNNVEISVYTTANTIKSSQKIISKSSVSKETENLEEYNNDFSKFNPIMTDQKTIKIIGTQQPTKILDEKTVFVFYVDVSGSMADIINNIPCNINQKQTRMVINQTDTSIMVDQKQTQMEIDQTDTSIMVDQKQTQMEIDQTKNNVNTDFNTINIIQNKNKKVKFSYDDIDTNYNKFKLEKINKFNTYNETYIICDTLDPIYIEIKSDFATFKFKCINGQALDFFNKIKENTLINMYCTLLEKFNELFKNVKCNNDRIEKIKDLGLLIGSPEYNVVFKEINNNPINQKPIELYFIALINQIKRLVNKTKYKSDYLLDRMINESPIALLRQVSARASSTYTTTSVQNPFVNDDLYDKNINTCNICYQNPKEIVYDCGHCVACTKCTKQIFFNIDEDIEITNNQLDIRIQSNDINTTNIITSIDNIDLRLHSLQPSFENFHKSCPLCRKHVSSVRLLSIIDKENRFKCISEDCANIATYMSESCGHLTYCKLCWKTLKKSNNLVCKCTKEIKKYVYVYNN